ncbi:MAG TPA: hypothetical protein VI278_08025 [Nitrososphaeraceae archaeon]
MSNDTGVISTTFLITGSYLLIIGLDSAAFYLATDSSLRRIIAKSPQEHDILKSLDYSEAQDVVTTKVKDLGREVYDQIEFDNLFYISCDPANIQEYINEVLLEVRRGDRNLLQKGKDKPSSNQAQK